MHGWASEVIGAVGAPETAPEGYISVFFAPTDTSREAGRQAAGRIFGGRTTDRDEPTTWQTRPGSIRRRLRLGHPQPFAAPASRRDRAPGVRRQRRTRPQDPPALLVPERRATPGRAAHDLPDSAHGFLFQYHDKFAADVHAFLEESD